MRSRSLGAPSMALVVSLSLTAAAVVASLFAMGCVPPATTLHVARPDPFLHQRRYQLAPFVYDGADLVARPSVTAIDDAAARANLVSGLEALERVFAETLRDRLGAAEIVPTRTPDPAGFVIEPHVVVADPGIYERFVIEKHVRWRLVARSQHFSFTTLHVRIVAPGGAYDEVVVHYESPAGPIFNSASWRLGNDGKACGMQLAAYLSRRIDGD